MLASVLKEQMLILVLAQQGMSMSMECAKVLNAEIEQLDKPFSVISMGKDAENTALTMEKVAYMEFVILINAHLIQLSARCHLLINGMVVILKRDLNFVLVFFKQPIQIIGHALMKIMIDVVRELVSEHAL